MAQFPKPHPLYLVLLFSLVFSYYHLAIAQEENGPQLYIPNNFLVTEGGTISIPVSYRANGNAVAALIFSIDYDQSCLFLDLTDKDSNGRPDSIVFLAPPGMLASVTVDPADMDSEIDVIVADYVPPFSIFPNVEALMLIEFKTICQPPSGGRVHASVNFSTEPSPSFGSATGQVIAGSSVNGGITVESNHPAPTMTPTATLIPTSGPPTPTPTFVPTKVPTTVVDAFTAEIVEDGIQLTWRTSHEQNTQSFAIHRMALGQDSTFAPIVTGIRAQGQEGGLYQYLDDQADRASGYSYLLVEAKQSGRFVAYYDLLIVVGLGSDSPYHIHLPLISR